MESKEYVPAADMTPSDMVSTCERHDLWLLIEYDVPGGESGRVAYTSVEGVSDCWVYWDEDNDSGHVTRPESVQMAVMDADRVKFVEEPPFRPGDSS